jgi:hypothetical protein
MAVLRAAGHIADLRRFDTGLCRHARGQLLPLYKVGRTLRSAPFVSAGGQAIGTTVGAGTTQLIYPSGVTSNTHVLPGGDIEIYSLNWTIGSYATYDPAAQTLKVGNPGSTDSAPSLLRCR